MRLLLTGASGSFGAAMIRRLLANGAAEKIVAYSRNESAQARLRASLGNPSNVEWILGDVRNRESLYDAMHRIDTIIHAAAMKRVDGNDPGEVYSVNVYGTIQVVRAALKRNVPRVLLISTDKACAPATPYGASKLAAEFYAVYANRWGHPHTRISCTRWGNVLGSAGSVVETWRRQAATGRITMTMPEATRFWLPMQRATSFTLIALRAMLGGEIFVPLMGSATLCTLAHAVAPEAEYTRIPMRAGEKLHEIIISKDEASRALYMVKEQCYMIEPADPQWDYMRRAGTRPTMDMSSFHAERIESKGLRQMIGGEDE